MNTTRSSCLVLLAVAGAVHAQEPAPVTQVPVPANARLLRVKPVRYRIPAGWEEHLITVKFRDGLTVRLRDGALTDLGTDALAGAGPVLARTAGGTWSRTHSVAEQELDRLRANGERNVRHALPDLNLQFRCELPAGVDAGTIIDALNALGCVEMAESIPKIQPPPQAQDVRYRQGYCEPAPRGTGAGPFRGLPDLNPITNFGSNGNNARIVDIEYGFDQAHPELPPVTWLTGPGYSTPAWTDHGTAVLGLLGARDDGFGTTGMAPGAQLNFARAATPGGGYDIDASITQAVSLVGQGGIILLEQQVAGPHYVGPPGSQNGLVAVEWYSSTYASIQMAIANGMTVVEAAGNGAEDLDHPDYGQWFSVAHDSGALIVGAGAAPAPSPPVPPSSTPPMRSRLAFSNYGQTVDLQGWGERVVTTGYGDLPIGGFGTYTQVFGGTSSASAVIAGCCALFQSRHFEQRVFYLSPTELRTALRQSGSPQTGAAVTQNIGPLPDLMRSALQMRLYGGLGVAHGFAPGAPGVGGSGIQHVTGLENIFAMAEFDDDGPAGPNPIRLYVAGDFTKIGNRPANNIACWNGVGWQELAGGLGGTVRALAVHGNQLYAGGFFPGGVQRWNGTAWSGTGNVLFSVYALASFGGQLVAGGDFVIPPVWPAVMPMNCVARFNGASWSPMSSTSPGFDNRVSALEVYNGQLIAGGSFQFSGPTLTRSLASWNGSVWNEFGGGTMFPGDQVLALESIPIANTNANYLVVGGTFWSIGGIGCATQGVAVWNGAPPWNTPWSPVAQPFAIAGFEDGSDPTLPRQRDAYLSGPSGVCRLDLTGGLPPAMLPWGSPNAECLLAFDEDGPGAEPPSLLAGGLFFGGPAPSVGLGKHFGRAPVPVIGLQQVVPTACGWPWAPAISTTGDPVLGAPFTVQFDCLPESLPALVVGLPQPLPIPLGCSWAAPCALGADPIAVDFGVQSGTYNFPNLTSLVGVSLAFEGFEFMALPVGPMCIPGWLGVTLRTSDTLVLTF